MQRVDIPVEHPLDGLGVVQDAVVGGLRQRHDTRLHGIGIDALQQRIGPDLLPDRGRLELALRNRADDAEVVARGLQEHRNGTRHDDRVQDRLVAVAVHHHDVAGRHRVMPDDLVGGAGAVGDEEAVVRIEDACGVALAGGHRSAVIEQLAQLVDRVAHVRAQHVLAEELVEHLPDRAFQERHAAGVAGAMPGVGAILGVIEQRLEERRLDPLQIRLRFPDDVARHEFRRVLVHVDEAVQLAQDVVGDVARGLGLAIHVDRHIGVLAAHFLDEAAQVHHRRIEIRAGREFLVIDGQDEGAGAALLLRELREVTVAGHPQDLEAFALDGLRQRTNAQPGGVLRAVVLVDDDDGEAEFHWGPFAAAAKNGKTGAKCMQRTARLLAPPLNLLKMGPVSKNEEGRWRNPRSGGS